MGSSIFFFDATLLATVNWAGERHLSLPGQSKPYLVFFKFVISFGKLESYQQLWRRSQKVERDTSWKDQVIFSPWFQRSLRPSYILIIGLCELIFFFGLSWVSVNHILLLTIRQKIKIKNQPETIQSALRKALYPWIRLNLDRSVAYPGSPGWWVTAKTEPGPWPQAWPLCILQGPGRLHAQPGCRHPDSLQPFFTLCHQYLPKWSAGKSVSLFYSHFFKQSVSLIKNIPK